MKLALAIGNRFNPWHFQGYGLLRGHPEITVFRATSEIQMYFDERNDASFDFQFEPLQFESPFSSRISWRLIKKRLSGEEPRIAPFHQRLKGFDLIQSWELFTDWSEEALIAHERYGIPLVVMVWDNIPFNMERHPERRKLKERVARGADRFIVHTERSRRMLDMEGAPADRVVMIHPGVDTERFSPGPRDRAAFGRAEDEFVILFVGWFLPRKGLDFLLLAMRELLNDPACRDRKIRLFVVGSGPGKARIDTLVERLGIASACTFLGSLPYGRMPEVFRAADVFVLPSIATPEWQEQFGMSLIEAMACGTPVVTTQSGAIPEIVGDSAMLCQPNDFVSLLESLQLVIHDAARREQLAASGRARALDRFRLDAFAHALSDVYEELIVECGGSTPPC